MACLRAIGSFDGYESHRRRQCIGFLTTGCQARCTRAICLLRNQENVVVKFIQPNGICYQKHIGLDAFKEMTVVSVKKLRHTAAFPSDLSKHIFARCITRKFPLRLLKPNLLKKKYSILIVTTIRN